MYDRWETQVWQNEIFFSSLKYIHCMCHDMLKATRLYRIIVNDYASEKRFVCWTDFWLCSSSLALCSSLVKPQLFLYTFSVSVAVICLLHTQQQYWLYLNIFPEIMTIKQLPFTSLSITSVTLAPWPEASTTTKKTTTVWASLRMLGWQDPWRRTYK